MSDAQGAGIETNIDCMVRQSEGRLHCFLKHLQENRGRVPYCPGCFSFLGGNVPLMLERPTAYELPYDQWTFFSWIDRWSRYHRSATRSSHLHEIPVPKPNEIYHLRKGLQTGLYPAPDYMCRTFETPFLAVLGKGGRFAPDGFPRNQTAPVAKRCVTTGVIEDTGDDRFGYSSPTRKRLFSCEER